MNQVLEAIADRRSIRSYTDIPVTDAQLALLEKAALEAPSAVNRQPYHFTFVRDKVLLDAFKAAANPDMDILRGAPMVCFIFGDTSSVWAPIDSGIAVENLALAAHSLGLGSVILGMPREVFAKNGDAWRGRLCCPAGMDFMIAIGIGTPAAGKDAHPVREGLITEL